MKTLVKLRKIAERAKANKGFKFTSLIHLIDEEMLLYCFALLKRDKANGIDGESVDQYGENLRENIQRVIGELKSQSYRPKPVKRVYIPKAGGKGKRPLGIPCVEDKLVQVALKMILESIYEQDFHQRSFGFRPNRSCHKAVHCLDKLVMWRPTNFIVEVDIKGFFDNVNHHWLLRCLEERVADPNLIWLIKRFLRNGIYENGQIQKCEKGVPQGGIVSPILANIYLHYVLDLWLEKKFKKSTSGFVDFVRYADDFIVTCEKRQDADRLMRELEERFAKFHLEVSKEKSKIVFFGRNAQKYFEKVNQKRKRPETFDFLGFTHYCTKSRKGLFVVGKRTSKKSLNRGIRDLTEFVRKVRSTIELKDWWKVFIQKVRGHNIYFGINGNLISVRKFMEVVRKLAFKWINRRSQKKSMTWNKFRTFLEWNPLPKIQVHYDMYAPFPLDANK